MLTVVKIGGPVIDDPAVLQKFLRDFSELKGHKILVHGGGKEATRLAQTLGIETKMIEGRRVTSAQMLEVCLMIYAGSINTTLTASLQGLGVNAIGLSGCDGACIRAMKRAPEPTDYGLAGDISLKGVSQTFFQELLERGLTPVVSAIAMGEAGELLNCNADGVACAVASALGADNLIYCIDQPGIMYDIDDPESLVPQLCSCTIDSLIHAGAVSQGMLPKLKYALQALNNGVKNVIIKQAGNLANSIETIITNA